MSLKNLVIGALVSVGLLTANLAMAQTGKGTSTTTANAGKKDVKKDEKDIKKDKKDVKKDEKNI